MFWMPKQNLLSLRDGILADARQHGRDLWDVQESKTENVWGVDREEAVIRARAMLDKLLPTAICFDHGYGTIKDGNIFVSSRQVQPYLGADMECCWNTFPAGSNIPILEQHITIILWRKLYPERYKNRPYSIRVNRTYYRQGPTLVQAILLCVQVACVLGFGCNVLMDLIKPGGTLSKVKMDFWTTFSCFLSLALTFRWFRSLWK